MTAIYYDTSADAIVVQGIDTYQPRTLAAGLMSDGATVLVTNLAGRQDYAGPWAGITDGAGVGFVSAAACLAYLAGVFGTSRSDAVLTAAKAIFASYAAMYLTASTVAPADPTVGTYVFAGIAMQSAVAGGSITLCRRDTCVFSGWAWQPQEPVYALPGGTLTQTPPQSGTFHRIGSALDPITLLVEPGEVVTL